MFNKKIIATSIAALFSTQVALAQADTGTAVPDEPEVTDKVEQDNSKEVNLKLESEEDSSSFGFGSLLGALGLAGVAAAAGGGGGSDSALAPAPVATNPEQAETIQTTPVTPGPVADAPTQAPTQAPAVESPAPSVVLTSEYSDFFAGAVVRGVNALSAVNQGLTGKGVSVLVMDTGVFQHPDLPSNMVDAGEYTFENNGGSAFNDPSGHGTMTAGVIAAQANNTGAVGLAPGVTLHAAKVFDSKGQGSTTQFGQALEYASANGVQIVNMSLNLFGTSEVFTKDLENYIVSGGLVVVSAGNSGLDNPASPTVPSLVTGDGPAVGGLLVVGQGVYSREGVFSRISPDANRAGFAKDYYLIAPHGNYTTSANGGYVNYVGSSAAAPVVTSAAALLKEKWSQLTNKQIASLLLNTATDVGDPGTDEIFGRGLLNVDAALQPQGVTTTEVNGKPTGTAEFARAVQAGMPVGGYVSGQLVYVDEYGRDFTEDAATFIDRNDKSVSYELLQDVAVTSHKSSDVAQGNFAMGLAQSNKAEMINASGLVFPFATKQGQVQPLMGTVTLGLAQSTWATMGFGDKGSSVSLSQRLGSWTLGYATESGECSSSANCSNDVQTFSVNYAVAASGFNVGAYHKASFNSVDTQALAMKYDQTKLGVFGVWKMSGDWVGGLRVEQAQALRNGSIDQVAIGFDQSTGQFIKGSLQLASQAITEFEISAVNTLTTQENMKYSLTGSNQNLGVRVNYSLSF